MVELYRPPPAEQIFKSFLPGKYIGYTVADYFCERFPYLHREGWIELIRDGRITVNERRVEPEDVLKEHDWIVTRLGLREEPAANRTLELIYEDDHIRAFNKGAPLAMHPSGRFFKNSLTEILKEEYPDETPRPVQRLDVMTTGVVVFAKTRAAAAHLMHEFTGNRVEKEYLALVDGVPAEKSFTVDAPVGKVPGAARGTGHEIINPKSAVTRFEWLAGLKGRSLLKAVPFSGRTNQIRVHLASRGLPVVNDPVYGRESEGPCFSGLHSLRLGFNGIEGWQEIRAPWPEHFQPFCEAAGPGVAPPAQENP